MNKFSIFNDSTGIPGDMARGAEPGKDRESGADSPPLGGFPLCPREITPKTIRF